MTGWPRRHLRSLGGFARYSTEDVTVPHFEKMLYDNGQLMEVYADAYRRDPQPAYSCRRGDARVPSRVR
jgi:uncharacterized protein YyaL (SSP411 family)